MSVLQLSNYTTRTICIWLLDSIWNVLRAHLPYSPFWIEGFQKKKEKKLRVSIFFPTFGWQKRWKSMRIGESQELLWSHFCLEEKMQKDFFLDFVYFFLRFCIFKWMVRKHIPFYFFGTLKILYSHLVKSYLFLSSDWPKKKNSYLYFFFFPSFLTQVAKSDVRETIINNLYRWCSANGHVGRVIESLQGKAQSG